MQDPDSLIPDRIKSQARQVEKRRQDIIQLAREQLDLDDELELDDDARVSEPIPPESGDNGAWVQTWSWMSFEGTPLDRNP